MHCFKRSGHIVTQNKWLMIGLPANAEGIKVAQLLCL